MKKVLKNIGIVIIIIIAAVIVLTNIGKVFMSMNNQTNTQSLKAMIAELNKHLPHKGFDGFDFFIMNRVLFEDDNVVWEFTLDTTFFYPTRESVMSESINGSVLISGDRNQNLDLDTLLSNELLKESHQLDMLYYYLFAKKMKANAFYEEIMRCQCSQTWRFYSPFSDNKCEFSMSYDEQKTLEEYCKNNPNDALQEFLFDYIQRQNRLLTIASYNADVIMRMDLNNESIILYNTLDKSYSEDGNKPISNLKANISEMRDALSEDIRTLPLFFGIKEICERTKKSLIIRYTDWNKTDSIDFVMY